MYGLTKKNKEFVFKKIEKQKDFLYSHYIEVQNQKVQLASFFKNTFINSDRYIAELQHRVWSLVEYSKNRDLVNVFLTLTLPSEYHPTKTLRNGKIVKNPKYAHQNIVLYDIDTKEKSTKYEKMIFKYYKTIGIIKFTGKTKTISLLPKDYEPKKASKELTNMFERIRKDRSFQDIEKDDRVYFRVTEPHKSGTPHLHISLFIPRDNVARFVQAVHRIYPAPMADIATTYIPNNYELHQKVYKRNGVWHSAYKLDKENKGYIKLEIENSVSYLMKYIYKTLDDLRDDKGITEITMWYIFHGICRFYTSRTLMSLNVYRPLVGKLSLLELTHHYNNDIVTVFLDLDTKKPKIIQYDDCIIWSKKDFELKQYDDEQKFQSMPKKIDTIDIEIDGDEFYMIVGGSKLYSKPTRVEPEDEDYIIPVTRMKMFQLYSYYHSLDTNDPSLNIHHFGHVQNTMIKRGLLEGDVIPIDDYRIAMEVF